MAQMAPPVAMLLPAVLADAAASVAPDGAAELLRGVMYLAVTATTIFVVWEKYRAWRDGVKKDDQETVKQEDLAEAVKKIELDFVKRSELADLCVRKGELTELAASLKERIGVIGDRQRETDEYTHKQAHELRNQLHAAQAKVDVTSVLSEQQGRKLDHITALLEDHSRRLERLALLGRVAVRRRKHKEGENDGEAG